MFFPALSNPLMLYLRVTLHSEKSLTVIQSSYTIQSLLLMIVMYEAPATATMPKAIVHHERELGQFCSKATNGGVQWAEWKVHTYSLQHLRWNWVKQLSLFAAHTDERRGLHLSVPLFKVNGWAPVVESTSCPKSLSGAQSGNTDRHSVAKQHRCGTCTHLVVHVHVAARAHMRHSLKRHTVEALYNRAFLRGLHRAKHYWPQI